MAHGATVFADSVCSSSDVDTCRWVGRCFGLCRPLFRIGSAVISDWVGRYFGLGRPLFRTGSAVVSDWVGRYSDWAAQQTPRFGCRRESSAHCTKSGTYAQRHLRHSRRRRAQQAVSRGFSLPTGPARWRAGCGAAWVLLVQRYPARGRAGAWAGGPRRAVETTSSAIAQRQSRAGLTRC